MKLLGQLLAACAAMIMVGLITGLIARAGLDGNTTPPVSPMRWQGVDAQGQPCLRRQAGCD